MKRGRSEEEVRRGRSEASKKGDEEEMRRGKKTKKKKGRKRLRPGFNIQGLSVS